MTREIVPRIDRISLLLDQFYSETFLNWRLQLTINKSRIAPVEWRDVLTSPRLGFHLGPESVAKDCLVLFQALKLETSINFNQEVISEMCGDDLGRPRMMSVHPPGISIWYSNWINWRKVFRCFWRGMEYLFVMCYVSYSSTCPMELSKPRFTVGPLNFYIEMTAILAWHLFYSLFMVLAPQKTKPEVV